MSPDAITPILQVRQRQVSPDLYEAMPVALDPILRRVYAARQVQPGELGESLADMLPVGSLGGVQEAAAMLAEARRDQAAIVVVGDFDADGATATALMVSALRAMGFAAVSYLVPDRFELGYGLSPAVVDMARALQPRLIITVDNGITSLEGVAHARSLGIDVIVTDHHLPGAVLPDARVIINPNLPGESFASKALCGVGVAFYLMAALARELGERDLADYRTSQRAVVDGLDLVALGTVADLVRLDRNNRILVSEGLRRMRAGRIRPGLRALFQVAGRNAQMACSSDLGFAIAPRLNAAGRLTDMSLGIDCLLAADEARGMTLALRLDQINRERRELQGQMQAEAEEYLRKLGSGRQADPDHALCLFDPGWHEGVVGLVASRVKERTGRPVVAFARGGEPGVLKGSARSIDGLHIRDVFAAIAARGQVQGMIFGGHAMAAGLRLPAGQLENFRVALATEVGRQLAGLDLGRVLWTDGPLDPGQLHMDLAETLHFAGPWGQGFPEPLFDNRFRVLDQRVLKDAHLRLSLRHVDGGNPVDAIAFGETRSLPGQVRVIYRLGVNEYAGRRRQQLVVEQIQSD